MKKLIAALFTAALMAAGLVVATGGTASADCTPTNYAGCVATRTKVDSPGVVVQGQKAQICVTVNARGSNLEPRGRVVVKVTRNAGGYFFKKSKPYNGSEVCVKTSRLQKRGGYNIDAAFKAPNNSVFINSFGSGGFDVVS